jgi:hypothetical protein
VEHEKGGNAMDKQFIGSNMMPTETAGRGEVSDGSPTPRIQSFKMCSDFVNIFLGRDTSCPLKAVSRPDITRTTGPFQNTATGADFHCE